MIKDVVVKIAEKEIKFQVKDIYIFPVWQVFHNATHKVYVEQSSDTLLLIQKQTTSVEVMRSLYLLSFFVIFASVQPLLLDNHRRPTKCYSRSFELIPEGNVVGRGFKNWDNYTQAKWVVVMTAFKHHDEITTFNFKVHKGMLHWGEVSQLRVQSKREEVQPEQGKRAHRSSGQVQRLPLLYKDHTKIAVALVVITDTV